eukprot:11155497-Lingulodinium_polyedra.AAC.1
MLVCPAASVAMPRRRPRPKQQKATTCVPPRQNGHGRRHSRYDCRESYAQTNRNARFASTKRAFGRELIRA